MTVKLSMPANVHEQSLKQHMKQVEIRVSPWSRNVRPATVILNIVELQLDVCKKNNPDGCILILGLSIKLLLFHINWVEKSLREPWGNTESCPSPASPSNQTQPYFLPDPIQVANDLF